ISFGEGIHPFKAEKFLPGNFTPAFITSTSNAILPSYEFLASDNISKNVVTGNDGSLLDLLDNLGKLPGSYSRAEWISGGLIIPALNLLQIALTTLLEFGFRTLAAMLLKPISNLFKSDAFKADDDDSPFVKTI